MILVVTVVAGGAIAAHGRVTRRIAARAVAGVPERRCRPAEATRRDGALGAARGAALGEARSVRSFGARLSAKHRETREASASSGRIAACSAAPVLSIASARLSPFSLTNTRCSATVLKPSTNRRIFSTSETNHKYDHIQIHTQKKKFHWTYNLHTCFVTLFRYELMILADCSNTTTFL